MTYSCTVQSGSKVIEQEREVRMERDTMRKEIEVRDGGRTDDRSEQERERVGERKNWGCVKEEERGIQL